jgi:hypothetical protein
MDDLAKAYLALGLKAGASPEEIKQAYRDLVRVWHPDRFGHDERLRLIAQDKLKEINGVYEFLQANVFEASITPDQTAPAEPEVTTDDTASAESPSATRSRATFWVILSTLVVALTAATVFLVTNKRRSESPVATNHALISKPRYALTCNQGGRVEIATTGSLSGTFTVECWTSTRRPRGTGTILSSRGPQDFSFDIKFREGKRFHGDIGDGSRWLMKMANARFSYNRGLWYHIAYVVTPTNYSIYVNGMLTEDGPIYPPASPLLYDADHRLCLGADVLEPADLDGSIAEVRIWQIARTAEQIKATLNASLTGNQPGLQGYWRFEEGSGTESADNSGNGFTARLIGNVEWTTNLPLIAVGSR